MNWIVTWEAVEVIRLVPFAGGLNFRDIGGYPAGNAGQTRWGAVYRSDSLHFLTPEDLPAFDALRIKVIYDCAGLMNWHSSPDHGNTSISNSQAEFR